MRENSSLGSVVSSFWIVRQLKTYEVRGVLCATLASTGVLFMDLSARLLRSQVTKIRFCQVLRFFSSFAQNLRRFFVSVRLLHDVPQHCVLLDAFVLHDSTKLMGETTNEFNVIVHCIVACESESESSRR